MAFLVFGWVIVLLMNLLNLSAWHWPFPDVQSILVALVSFGTLWQLSSGRLQWRRHPATGPGEGEACDE
jgi:hypothetical protein